MSAPTRDPADPMSYSVRRPSPDVVARVGAAVDDDAAREAARLEWLGNDLCDGKGCDECASFVSGWAGESGPDGRTSWRLDRARRAGRRAHAKRVAKRAALGDPLAMFAYGIAIGVFITLAAVALDDARAALTTPCPPAPAAVSAPGGVDAAHRSE